jgi:hypothetical protein
MHRLIEFISGVSALSAVPAIWLGRRLRGLLWHYAWASFIADILTVSFLQYLGTNGKLVIGNIFCMVEFFLISLYFGRALFRGWAYGVFVALIIAWGTYLFISTLSVIHSRVNWEYIAVNYSIFVLLCLLSLFKVIRNIEHLKIEQSPLFIFSAAFLLYASYSLLLMLFADRFKSAPQTLREELWSVHNILNALKNLAIARIFILQQKAKPR